MKRLLVVLAAVLVIGAAGALAFWYFAEGRISSFASTPFGAATPRLVSIPAGTNPRGVAKLLAQGNAVSDAELTYQYLRREKLGPRLRAGEYEFTGALTPAQVIDKLVRGDVKQYRFTLPEGLRVDETISILAASELGLSRDKLTSLATTTGFVRSLGVPSDSLEGFLFPDTYSFPRGSSEEAVLRRLAARALEEARKPGRKAGVELGVLETMTLASIIEKETGSGDERPRISCVFHNRLRLGMKLETDPTVLYAKLLRTGSFTKNITRADLRADHPYNTYTRAGLPPGPIASPGAAAISAALNPIDCDDLYFVSKNDGTHVFCPDLKCHQANVKRWQVEFFRKQ